MKIFITGIRGFLGAALAAELRAQGCAVQGSTHRRGHLPDAATPVEWLPGTTPETAWFAGSDAVVHCAYDPATGAYERNLRLTQEAFTAAEAAGVKLQIFISSHSARPDAYGDYGRQKFALEQYFLERGHTIVRPGLVLGPGGLYATLRRQLRRTPLLLLPAPDQLPVFTIALADLLRALQIILAQDRRGAFNLFAPPLPLGDFARAVLRAGGRRTIIAPLPGALLEAALGLFDRIFRVPPPALARLYTARQNIREPDYHRSDLALFVPSPQGLEEALLKAESALAGEGG